MATLEKIRSKGVLLIVVVGLALLSFIIGDFLTQGSTFFNQSKETVADINGEKVKIADYQEMIDQIVIVQKIESGVTEVDEQTMQQIRSYVWENMVNEKLLTAEAEKMGLTVTADELSDQLIGNNVHPIIQQRRIFYDESGRFNKSNLINFLNQIKEAPSEEANNQQFKDLQKYWLFWEKNIKFAILQDKYNVLISKTVVPNSVDAKFNFDARAINYDVNYVVQPYFAVSDSSVTVTDKEIKDKYNEKIKLFKQDANVSLKFVSFDVRAQEADYKEAEAWMNKTGNEFKTTEDVTSLVNSNSDVPYTGKNYTIFTVPAHLKDFAFSGSTGQIYGPVFANETFTMAKIMESGISSPDSVKLRHIFLTTDQVGKADSLIAALKAGADFGALAKQFSAVQQTAQNNGEIGWITENVQGLDKEIMTSAFSKGVNEIFTIKNAQGTQIMQVTEKTAPRSKVKLAILERKVFASTETVSKIFNEAKRFATELKAEDFDAKAKESKVIIRQADEILASSEQIQNIEQSRQIVRWAFENDQESVSDVFECNQQFIVAVVTDKNEKGYRPLNKVSDQLKAEIIKDKKAELMIKQLASKGSNLNAIAASIGQEVKQAPMVNFAGYQFGVAGYEPAVIGKTTKQKLNTVSAPVKGNAGVYVIMPVNAVKSAEQFNVAMEKQQLLSRFSFSLPYNILVDLKDKTDITDNRLNFY